MILHDTYATNTHSIDELKALVEPVLGLEFAPHYGDYAGGDYWRWGPYGHGEKIQIQLNDYDTMEPGELLEPELSEYPVLMIVESSPRADELWEKLRAIEGLELLIRRPSRPNEGP